MVKELLATEETYVKDLDTAIIVFLHPLRALFCDPIFVKREESHLDHPEERIRRVNFEPPKDDRAKEKKVLLTEDLLQTMFGNLEDILERHRALLASLRKAVQEWSPVQTLGNIFIELVGFSLKTSVTFSLLHFSHFLDVLTASRVTLLWWATMYHIATTLTTPSRPWTTARKRARSFAGFWRLPRRSSESRNTSSPHS